MTAMLAQPRRSTYNREHKQDLLELAKDFRELGMTDLAERAETAAHEQAQASKARPAQGYQL